MHISYIPYFPVDKRMRYLYKRSKFVKNEHAPVWDARYTLGARYLYIKRNVKKVWGARYLPENTVI
jgi:hypothetical protein